MIYQWRHISMDPAAAQTAARGCRPGADNAPSAAPQKLAAARLFISKNSHLCALHCVLLPFFCPAISRLPPQRRVRLLFAGYYFVSLKRILGRRAAQKAVCIMLGELFESNSSELRAPIASGGGRRYRIRTLSQPSPLHTRNLRNS